MQFFTSLLTASLLTLSLVSAETKRQASIIGSPKKIERRAPTPEAERIKRQQSAAAQQNKQRFAWDQPKETFDEKLERIRSQRASGRQGSILSDDILSSLLGKKPEVPKPESPRASSKINIDELLGEDAVRKPVEGAAEEDKSADFMSTFRQVSQKILKDAKLEGLDELVKEYAGKDPMEVLSSPKVTESIQKLTDQFVNNMPKDKVADLLDSFQNDDVMKPLRELSNKFMGTLKQSGEEPTNNDLLSDFYKNFGKGDSKFDLGSMNGLMKELMTPPKNGGGLFSRFFDDLTDASDGEDDAYLAQFVEKMKAPKMKMKRDV